MLPQRLMEREGLKDQGFRETAESTKTEYKSVVLHSKRGSRNLYLVVGSQGEGERGYGPEGEVAWRERGE